MDSSNTQRSSSKIQLMVIWQSLVVKTYRSFFYQLAQKPSLELGLVAPETFTELGFQNIPCEPFDNKPRVKSFSLRSKVYHTQAVLFRRLHRAFQDFFNRDHTKVIFCLAEPYSITAFVVWLKARLLYGKKFHLILFSLQNIKKDFPKPLQWIQMIMFKRSSAVAILGPEQEDVIRAQGYKGKTFDFPLWFDSDKFQPLSKGEACRQLSSTIPARIRQDTIKIAYVGALVEQKGVLDILACLRDLQGELQGQVDFLFIGKGELEAEVQSAIKKFNQDHEWVHYLGFLAHGDMGALLNFADVLLVPSRTKSHWKEQFGRVIVEAQACGCLVIGSDSGHIPHLIDDAYCFPEGDSKAMGVCIQRALSSIRSNASLIRQAQVERGSAYSDRALADRFYKELETIIQPR
ncbi:glycosyltransferase family 4 protein [Pseudobacteriovorax antillogorgiicola]|uniref:Glycosyltransferase involved in cell wall bisynthesis n=1 Tax=Pseudobacteriovorax antillogorgiicola TaxID=1513793 RepID=A0A1Y6BZU9_9BACT|nr:glycosyltransferase [Pseudobacteriovorax antillogorgiicola]TCS51231.1 glycosyltransferase involved in cell wall biosynthesis [Pseudobacteriovorax antillogorgiicola]SMF36863.1 Glycosyltransferase involved in cell wall bisynthesis [Pseudobacteriovorax antillogorgiicola]